jgi:hypothetical protein
MDDGSDSPSDDGAGIADVARRLASTITDASTEAGERIAGLTESAGQAVRDADRVLRGSSDQTLTVVGALSVGLALGLLTGGTARLLVAAALLPAALAAGAALGRTDGAAGRARLQVH